jgi:hypothetical protein
VAPKVLEPDKVKVDRFDATPNPVPATAANTSLTFVGRNLSLGPLSIPWRIFKGPVL